MTFQLNCDITELVKEIVGDWVRLHYEYIHEQLVEKETTDADEVREFVLFEYFNSGERDFGRYAKEHLEFEWTVDIIQYCNAWLDDNYGPECLLDWKRYNDFKYILNQLGYVWSMENGDEIMEMFENLGLETPFK
jgi:hypothetical protein